MYMGAKKDALFVTSFFFFFLIRITSYDFSHNMSFYNEKNR